jgi:YbgC/YbaW family acyl-CoA thioester hydrolase
MMSKIFTRTFRVRFHEIDANGRVGVGTYLRYLMETAIDWGSANGLGLEDIDAHGHLWVTRETEFNIIKPLRYNEVFNFTIWLVKWRRVRGTRAFEIKLDESGAVIAQGLQQVAVLDSHSMRPTSPPGHLLEHYHIDNPRTFPQQRFPKVPLPPENAYMMQRKVEAHDLDLYDMVNNAVYAAYAEEASTQALAEVGWSPSYLKNQGLTIETRRIHIQYQSPAVWGDKLNLVTYLLGLGETGGSKYVRIERASDGAGVAECILDWVLVDRETGGVQPLPDSLLDSLKGSLAEAG